MKIQTIKETVRGAQDILARMAMHLYIDDIRSQARKLVEDSRRIAFLMGARRDYVWPGPSKSLGELCIELAQDRVRQGWVIGKVLEAAGAEKLGLYIDKEPIISLCRVLYHKHPSWEDIPRELPETHISA